MRQLRLFFGSLILSFSAVAPLSAYKAEEKAQLEQLFTSLKQAGSPIEAEKIASQINTLWRNANGDTASLLLSRADTAMEEENYPLALDLLDQLVALEPDFAEAWNRRAEVYYLLEDYTHALADLETVLMLEPRHYAALGGLGLILEDIGKDAQAYKALKRSLEIHPFQENVSQELETLETLVLGYTL